MSLFNDKTDLIENSSEQLEKKIKSIDESLIKEITKIYSAFRVGDVLEFDIQKAAELENKIIAAIKNTNYGTVVKSYLKDFDAIDDMNILIHKKLNDVNINNIINENARLSNYKKLIQDSLLGTNSLRQRSRQLDELISPLTNEIRKNAIIGSTYEDAIESIEAAILEQDLGLSRWSEQITRDALNQYDGLQDQEIRKEFNFEWGNYIGGISKNTRPLCFHMHTEHSSFKWSEIQPIIDPYVKDGIPIDTYTTETGQRKRRGAGIIPGTVASNFDVRRGGYNCKHYIVSSRKPVN